MENNNNKMEAMLLGIVSVVCLLIGGLSIAGSQVTFGSPLWILPGVIIGCWALKKLLNK